MDLFFIACKEEPKQSYCRLALISELPLVLAFTPDAFGRSSYI